MELSSTCMSCIIKREEEKLSELKDEEKGAEYMRRVLRHIADSPKNSNSPCIVSEIDKIYANYFGKRYSRQPEKDKFNKLMQGLQEEIRQRVEQYAEPVSCALKYARAANYIDFGAMKDVSVEKLVDLLRTAEQEELDEIEFQEFLSDLDNAKTLVYITDNCGEVILDMVLIEQLQKRRPDLKITALVRGDDALNDVTVKDAEAVGLTKLVPVVGNGTSIGGTQLERISPESRELLESADLILAKGMGNFETMSGTGLPVYYAFLCKCSRFTRVFNLPLNTGVFMKEDRIRI